MRTPEYYITDFYQKFFYEYNTEKDSLIYKPISLTEFTLILCFYDYLRTKEERLKFTQWIHKNKLYQNKKIQNWLELFYKYEYCTFYGVPYEKS